MHICEAQENIVCEPAVRSWVLDRRGLARSSHAARMGQAGSAPPM